MVKLGIMNGQELHELATTTGAQWGAASHDLNLTLLSWPCGHVVAAHVSEEVDVVLIGVGGRGEVTADEQPFMLVPGVVLPIPKGASRAIHSTSELPSAFPISAFIGVEAG